MKLQVGGYIDFPTIIIETIATNCNDYTITKDAEKELAATFVHHTTQVPVMQQEPRMKEMPEEEIDLDFFDGGSVNNYKQKYLLLKKVKNTSHHYHLVPSFLNLYQ